MQAAIKRRFKWSSARLNKSWGDNREALNRKSRSVTYQMKNNNLPNKRHVLTRLNMNESDAE